MKIITPGHTYELANFESKETSQVLQFIHKEPDPLDPTPGALRTVADGTTNEEVLAVLIDRLKFQNNKFPCRENEIAVTKLFEAAMWLDKRTADRKARNVEGKHLA